ncbi:hypothetical protein, conserved [Eimeria acervulina]|uniref:Uncharacterized protein n=1 Tax=Eimeria acervulina TaxID=5801 RepID=U6GJN9_EIMAC|nr:hypothetical protein, conserved [Eimeria acervulina]CDI80380.1 hypothetical protein, conserved [Eimeria acervulina]
MAGWTMYKAPRMPSRGRVRKPSVSIPSWTNADSTALSGAARTCTFTPDFLRQQRQQVAARNAAQRANMTTVEESQPSLSARVRRLRSKEGYPAQCFTFGKSENLAMSREVNSTEKALDSIREAEFCRQADMADFSEAWYSDLLATAADGLSEAVEGSSGSGGELGSHVERLLDIIRRDLQYGLRYTGLIDYVCCLNENDVKELIAQGTNLVEFLCQFKKSSFALC